MMHELLFSLINPPKDMKEFISGLRTLGLVHPAEVELFKEIGKVSANYHYFEEFRALVLNKNVAKMDLNLNGEVSDEHEELTQCGLYIRAFSNGLNTVLDDYRNEIFKTESTMLENSQLDISYIVGIIKKYETLFEMLKSMINTVRTVHGCLIIGRLRRYLDYAIPSVENATKTIIYSLNSIFYRHLANWIIFGDLHDDYSEFFIQDSKCDDDNFDFKFKKEDNTNVGKCGSFKVRKFIIRVDMLPSFIPLEVAEIILFMGRVVWIVQNDPKREFDLLLTNMRRDIWEGRSMEYFQKIQRLEVDVFKASFFEDTIDECRIKLSKYLWKLMIEEANFMYHMQIIRDYYALGRGELFQQFINVVDEQYNITPTTFFVKNLNLLFNETARKIYSENDQTYTKLKLVLPKTDENGGYAANSLLNMELSFNVSWPLHIIFHPKVMLLYNKLFGFLLRVKKTHINLNKLWLEHKKSKQKIHKSVWMLCHQLMFLINNIQYYLEVDVIESNFEMLKNSVKNANEFSDIIRVHKIFLSNLLSRTFVMNLDQNAHGSEQHGLYQLPTLNFENKTVIYVTILSLLETSDNFCVESRLWYEELDEEQMDKLHQIKLEVDVTVDTLLRSIFSLYQQSSSHYLLQLLNRIDFNRWYTKNITNLNLTMS